MNRLSFLMSAVLLSFFVAGCNQKTPEEAEAAKYPPAKPLTPEEQERAKALTGLPSQANTSR